MTFESWVTLAVLAGALALFATEWLSIDLVALLAMLVLVSAGVISPEQGVAGFSNKATITVAFMFVLSAALFRTGALQVVANRLAPLFRRRYRLGMLALMLLVAGISAFINNTPVVAVFIPVVVQLAKASGRSPAQMLIPLSFASIFGGTCTLIGTSTNIVVSGMAEAQGLPAFGMFDMTPAGLVFLAVGVGYMLLAGFRLLPSGPAEGAGLPEKFGMGPYVAEIALPAQAPEVGCAIMDAPLVRELDLDVAEVRRETGRFSVPPGDFMLRANDVLKVRGSVEKLRALQDRIRLLEHPPVADASDHRDAEWVEMLIPTQSELEGKTLREADFRKRFRAVPLAIGHREAVWHEQLYDTPMQAGDVVLAAVKPHYLKVLRRMEQRPDAPFVLLHRPEEPDFRPQTFAWVSGVLLAVVALATAEVLDIMVGTMLGVAVLVLRGIMNMKEVYESISWKVVFLLAGSFALGTAMQQTGLDRVFADGLLGSLGGWGPVAVVSGLYLGTSLLTEVMSNNAAAALLTPIAIAIAQQLGLSPQPFLMAIAFAASASFMTPVGYQTNTMVYTAGQYRFFDFVKVGSWLNLLFWLVATLIIPYFYPFQ
jgi:di/tricarboxylate transporter